MKAVVYGAPATMGSKRAFRAGNRFVVVDVNARKLRTFQESLRESMRETAPETPHLGPMRIRLEVWLRRPKGHFGTGKNAAKLKVNAPEYPATKPDLSKVLRAVEDCGSGIWWRDDAQIADATLTKFYSESGEECTIIQAWPIREM